MQVRASAPRMLQGRMFSEKYGVPGISMAGPGSGFPCSIYLRVCSGPNKHDYSRCIIRVAEVSTCSWTYNPWTRQYNSCDYDKLRRVRVRNSRTKPTSL